MTAPILVRAAQVLHPATGRVSALALAAFYFNHRLTCAACRSATAEPRGFDLRRCERGRRLAIAYSLNLSEEHQRRRVVADDVQ